MYKLRKILSIALTVTLFTGISAYAQQIPSNVKAEPVTESTTLSDTEWATLPRTYYNYTELSEQYCFAATGQSLLRYITGTEYDQNYIANKLGIPQGLKVSVGWYTEIMNELQNKIKYSFILSPTMNGMKNHMYSTIKNAQVPLTLMIKVDGGEWPYTADRHATNVIAVREDKNYFQIADPAIQRIDPNGNPYFLVSAEGVYNAVEPGYYGYNYAYKVNY